MSDLFIDLAKPFAAAAIKWRVGSTTQDKKRGLALAYIDARDVMQRLDDVVGVVNWQDEYVDSPSGRVFCKLSILVDGNWICKSDAAGDTDVAGLKGGVSDAFKRAAVKWGIGRDLYSMKSQWVEIVPRGRSFVIADHELARLAGGAVTQRPPAKSQTKRTITPPSPTPTPSPFDGEPRSASSVIAALQTAASGKDNPASDGQLKFMRASLSKVAVNKDRAAAFLAHVFDLTTSADCTNGQASAIIEWAGANKENGYEPLPQAAQELERIYTAWMKGQRQADLFPNAN